MRRGWPLADWCCLCKSVEESTNPILLQFRLRHSLWHFVLFLFSLSGHFPWLNRFDYGRTKT